MTLRLSFRELYQSLRKQSTFHDTTNSFPQNGANFEPIRSTIQIRVVHVIVPQTSFVRREMYPGLAYNRPSISVQYHLEEGDIKRQKAQKLTLSGLV